MTKDTPFFVYNINDVIHYCITLIVYPHTTDDAEIRLSELSHLSQAHHFLRPAQEKFVSRLGNFCSLPSALKFDGPLEEFLPTAGRISSDG